MHLLFPPAFLRDFLEEAVTSPVEKNTMELPCLPPSFVHLALCKAPSSLRASSSRTSSSSALARILLVRCDPGIAASCYPSFPNLPRFHSARPLPVICVVLAFPCSREKCSYLDHAPFPTFSSSPRPFLIVCSPPPQALFPSLRAFSNTEIGAAAHSSPPTLGQLSGRICLFARFL